MLSLHSHYKFPVSFCAAKLELDEANRVYLKSDLLVADMQQLPSRCGRPRDLLRDEQS